MRRARDIGGMSAEPAISARIEAGRAAVMAQTTRLHEGFGRVESRWKADGTRVTAADVAISENIFRELAARFPEDQFFSEELTPTGAPLPVTARHCWVLDPIDGTNNYALGIPHCAIGLALLTNGRPVYGFVYDLARRTLTEGGPGFGVRDGERQASMKTAALDGQSVVGFHSPYDKQYAAHAALLAANYKIRGLGSSTMHLAYVGVGLFDAVVDHNVKVWDIAAAVPLVLAGGGVVEFVTASPFPLRQFDLNMGRIFYVAGTKAGVAELRRLLGV
jgi:myo-inositol-1(or 4)-monophosphatase